MHLLQDWICMQGNGATLRAQSSREWLDLSAFSDVTLWLEVRSATFPAPGLLQLRYETSPTRDESLFGAVTILDLAVTKQPIITKLRLCDNPSIPLARWLRWRILTAQAGDWSVTFRVFAVPGRALAVMPAFDPASLNLSAWWRAPYQGSPWPGNPSLGVSSSRPLSEATNPPAVGSAINGYAPADFDGTNDRFVDTYTVANYFFAAAGSAVALVNIDAINTSIPIGGAISGNDTIFCDNGGYLGLLLGGAASNQAQAFLWDGVQRAVGVTVTTGSWQLLQMRWNASLLELRLNSGSWNTVAAGAVQSTTGTMMVGINQPNTQFFDGKMLELMFAPSRFDDSTFDQIKSYVNARYALSL